MDFKELFSVSKVFIRKPRYILPTYRATIQTIKICDDLYAEEHHNNGKENAFRHALWNYLICQKCFKISRSVEAARIWSDHFTGLHEKLSPNQKLAKTMDLHNNRFGQALFKGNEIPTEEIIHLFQQKMKLAIKVSKVEEIGKTKDKLVYIEG
ncbi:hypothetical protein LB465_09045 [Salegentibacter sp. LM13S]|uniref:DUF6973 domain-containing protein n=1 Tax=Salegentibacter lacus TaxID=2873599 RepID=UPI001CCF3F79|nr:hypothetical protein [Salegentibacter lacus]MBZ9630925.1 hypothetical protein [Salegentibacter lacus]